MNNNEIKHNNQSILRTMTTFGVCLPDQTPSPEARDKVLSPGRHAHARRRAQRPSGRARRRCRAHGDPGGSPAIRPSPRLPTASSGTPTASPEVADSRPPVIAIDGREFRATGGVRDEKKIGAMVSFLAVGIVFCRGFATTRHV